MGHAELDSDIVDRSYWDGKDNHLKKQILKRKMLTENISANTFSLFPTKISKTKTMERENNPTSANASTAQKQLVDHIKHVCLNGSIIHAHVKYCINNSVTALDKHIWMNRCLVM